MRDRAGLRWWPLALVLVLAALGVLTVWTVSIGRQRQDRVLLTAFLLMGTTLAAILWFLLLSRARARSRLIALLVLAVAGTFLHFTVRVSAVSGDLVPRFRWVWTQAPDAALDEPELDDAPAAGRPVSSEHDFPGYLGARGDGVVEGVALAADWAARPPREVWRREIGAGWSGFAIAGEHAVTMEQRGEEEWTSCYDLTSGDVLWYHAERARHDEPLGGPGPRATPAVSGSTVYTLGGTGVLNALDLRTGEPRWRHDLAELAGVSPPMYGYAASPVVRDGRVVVSAGGGVGRSLWAFDAATGEPVWSSGDAPSGYATPAFGTLGGRAQWVVFNAGSVNGYAADDGTPLWSVAWPEPTEEAAQPQIVDAERLLVSSGYGVGARLFRVRDEGDGFRAETLWESIRLKAKFSDFVVTGGHVFGLDDGILTVVSLEDGSRVWKRGRFGHGQFLLAGDKLVIQAESGAVVLAAARLDGYEELGRVDVFDSKTWNHPALAGNLLLVRNDREVALLELPVE